MESSRMITFAIVAHNEASTVGTVVRQAIVASGAGDRVLAVDSGSTDATADVARAAGAELLHAPTGKGRAMAVATAAAQTEWVCFLDSDVPADSPNYAACLREVATRTKADHLVGEYRDGLNTIMSNTSALYEPLVASLFPEAAGKFGSRPLTGFRVIRRHYLKPTEFPPDFGIEAYLNLHVLLSGGTHEVVPIGRYRSRFRYKPYMGSEIAKAILDLAVSHARLAPAARPEWDAWVDEAVEVISGYQGTAQERAAFRERLAALAQRPTPPRFPR
jgi:glucosyl-3-phosphoglycerate synthase